MTNRLELNWKLDGFVDEQRYYCSETSIDPLALPTPKVILAGDVRTYVDTAVTAGRVYYLRVGSVKNGVEKISNEIEVSTIAHPILSLFANSEKGLWLDFSDMSTMFQDSTGMEKVTALSQPIGKVLDKSKNGNHAQQPVNSKKPIFGPQGAYFDGLDDLLQTVGDVDYGNTLNLEIICKIDSVYNNLNNYPIVIESGAPYGSSGSFICFSRRTDRAIASVFRSGDSDLVTTYMGNTQSYNGVFVFKITPSKISIIVDGVSYDAVVSSSTNIINNRLTIGQDYANSVPSFKGHIKHIMIINRALTDLERDSVVSYMNTN